MEHVLSNSYELSILRWFALHSYSVAKYSSWGFSCPVTTCWLQTENLGVTLVVHQTVHPSLEHWMFELKNISTSFALQRAAMTDFDRYKLMRAKQAVSNLSSTHISHPLSSLPLSPFLLSYLFVHLKGHYLIHCLAPPNIFIHTVDSFMLELWCFLGT